MPRIHSILQGFVDINLETDEDIGTKIVLPGTIRQSQEDAVQKKSAANPNAPQLTLPVSIDKVVQAIGVSPADVKLAHIQGSRLYGVVSQSSDWDITIVISGSGPHEFKGVNVDGFEFDIHIYSQSIFQNLIDGHFMRELEVIYHPPGVRIVDEIEFNTSIDRTKLVNRVKIESDELWFRAKGILNSEGGDTYQALKTIWHSLRFLIFAEQILMDGEIIDYSAANYLREPIVNSKQKDFAYFEANFSVWREQFKIHLEEII